MFVSAPRALEAAGVLEQLEFEHDLGVGASGRCDLRPAPAMHGGLDDQVIQSRAGGGDPFG